MKLMTNQFGSRNGSEILNETFVFKFELGMNQIESVEEHLEGKKLGRIWEGTIHYSVLI